MLETLNLTQMKSNPKKIIVKKCADRFKGAKKRSKPRTNTTPKLYLKINQPSLTNFKYVWFRWLFNISIHRWIETSDGRRSKLSALQTPHDTVSLKLGREALLQTF